MFKLVKGKVDELEAGLNAAVAEGFTQLFREFPDDRPFDPTSAREPTTYAFLMQKPHAASPLPSAEQFDEMATSYGGSIRRLFVSLGLNVPPMPGNAPVVELVKRPVDPETPKP